LDTVKLREETREEAVPETSQRKFVTLHCWEFDREYGGMGVTRRNYSIKCTPKRKTIKIKLYILT